MSLNKVIKKNLVETKSQKESLLIERELVKARLMMILESEDNIKYFDFLSEEEQTRISFQIFEELSVLDNQGLINEEGLGDVLKSLFGYGMWSVPEAFAEKIINSILSALGMKDIYLKKVLVSFFSTNPKELINAFKDCRTMAKLVAKSLAEGFVMQVAQQKGFGGTGWDVVRNALEKQFQSMEFIKNIEDGFGNVICDLFSKFTSKGQDVLKNVKGATQPQVAPAK
jgi:hypothetical protein